MKQQNTMKNLLILFFLSFSFVLNAQDFTITNFEINLEITKEGSFLVKEIIDVHFDKKKRGIYRDIPTTYSINNAKVNMGVGNIDVLGHDYKVEKIKDKVNIRIGNPDIYVTGDQQYIISYKIEDGIISYQEHQEFHYDLTGNEWEAPIENVYFTITLPKGITLGPSDYKITGGRKNEMLDLAVINQVDSRTLKGNSLQPLAQYNGLTAAIKLPKNYLDVASNNVTFFEAEEEKVYQPWYIALPLALFAWFLSFWRKMRKTDFVAENDDVKTYPPEGLTSAHVGAFIDQTSHTRDIVSLLPYWGSEGYLEMKQIGDEVFLYKIKNIPPEYPEYEHIIFDRLFHDSEVSKISDLKTKFYPTLQKATSLLTKEIELQEYYNPKYTQFFKGPKLFLFPIVMVILGILSFIYLQLVFLGIGFIVLGLASLLLSLFKLPLTYKGAKLKSEIDAFQRFVKNPDKGVLETILEKDPSYFNKIFPFAVAFGMEKPFLSSLEPYISSAPYWYHSDLNNNSFSNFSSSFQPEVIQSAFSSVPGSSGGSSGGGFSSGSGVGGGGGGSW
jgi:uncharacterized membrane protein YgcG